MLHETAISHKILYETDRPSTELCRRQLSLSMKTRAKNKNKSSLVKVIAVLVIQTQSILLVQRYMEEIPSLPFSNGRTDLISMANCTFIVVNCCLFKKPVLVVCTMLQIYVILVFPREVPECCFRSNQGLVVLNMFSIMMYLNTSR